MSKPVVAVVGRPNVGKSTLFNALAGSRISIVEDTPGVTRDRIYAEVSWLDYQFTLIDTGGIEPESDDIIISRMREQAETAIMTADVILFLVDGIGDMLDHVIEQFETPAREEEEEDERPKIAVIGKPNAGKSSIINKLLGEERVIVSPVAGTTRDAIDTTVKRNGQEYIFIDTAGLRRKSKIKEELERYSIIRTVTAVERCDVAVLIIDATEGITEQDAKIAGIAHERGKGMIIAVNKWDLVEKDNTTMKKFTEKIREKLSYMPYAELIFLSAKTGQRLPKLFDMIDAVIENCALRVQTGVLNEILTEAMAMKQPPSDKGKRLRIYYITQVSVKPPTFVMFINEKKLTHFSYTRYIENQIRTTFGFRGTPIHFIYRERKEK